MRSKFILQYTRIHLQYVRRILRDSKSSNSLLAYLYSYLIVKALSKADHSRIRRLAETLVNKGHLIGNYFLALSHFLKGECLKAEQSIKKIPDFTKMPEIVFLYSEILVKQHKIESAWQLLEKIALTNPRRKVWVYLANLVNNKDDYKKFIALVDKVKQDTSFLKSDSLVQTKTNAALRAGLNDLALELAKNARCSLSKKNKKKSNEVYTRKLASQALSDLKKVFESNHITFFLISGTLLGCIREKKLLEHDKDIDIGVWDNNSYEQLAKILGNSGYFYIVPTRTKELVMLRHVNGIVIDVFIHHREPNDYWHAGVKIKWHNSPFELIETTFLGNSYLIPKNYDLYLTENYGDWRTPKTDFDSACDTSNLEIYNQVEMEIYLLRTDDLKQNEKKIK